jgi:predicted GIY-YIG superfamily endonuclease
MYYTYILFSPSHYQYYVGQTHVEPEEAVCQHNQKNRIHTKKGTPWQLVYAKPFENSTDSYLLMQSLKNIKSRRILECFIEHLTHVEK